jgi:hypothetical protein
MWHLRDAARRAAEMRARRNAKGLCVRCGKLPKFWGVRCIICRQVNARSPLPPSALKAIRLHRKAEAQFEINQVKDQAREAARALLASGNVSAKAGQALRLYVGLDGNRWRTYQQIGKLMNLSRERVRKLLLPSKIVLEAELAGRVPWRRVTKDPEHRTLPESSLLSL